MKLRNIALAIAILGFLLAGCQKVDDQKAYESGEKLATIQNEIVANFENLHELENNFQTVFEESLNAEKDLSNLADQNDPVYQNINERHQLVENISESAQESQELVDLLKEFEGNDRLTEPITHVVNHFETLNQSLAEFQANHQSYLETQGNYLLSLSQDDATHKDFSDGIEQINEDYVKEQEALQQLDKIMIALNKDLENFLSHAHALVNKEED